MYYLSDYLPQDVFTQIVHGNEKIKEISDENKKIIQFRDSSNIRLEKKPCPCMANKIKPPESS